MLFLQSRPPQPGNWAIQYKKNKEKIENDEVVHVECHVEYHKQTDETERQCHQEPHHRADARATFAGEFCGVQREKKLPANFAALSSSSYNYITVKVC